MTTNAEPLQCRECGYSIPMDGTDMPATCPQCGADLYEASAGEGVIAQPIQEVQDGATALETEEVRHKRRLKRIQAIFFAIWVIFTIITIGACAYIAIAIGGKNGLIGSVLVAAFGGLPVVGGGAYIVFKLIPDTE